MTEDLQGIVELLAENTHENWAAGRISQGLRYGPERNDADKEHPFLVPYELLTESEKEHDRKVVLEIVKTLIVRGFAIRKT